MCANIEPTKAAFATVKVVPNPKARLLAQVREVSRVRHYSIRTEQAYVNWIKRYIFFHNKRHPADMGEDEIRSFISELASKKSMAASTQTVALSAATLSAYPC